MSDDAHDSERMGRAFRAAGMAFRERLHLVPCVIARFRAQHEEPDPVSAGIGLHSLDPERATAGAHREADEAFRGPGPALYPDGRSRAQ